MTKVLITDDVPQQAVDALQEAGIEVQRGLADLAKPPKVAIIGAGPLPRNMIIGLDRMAQRGLGAAAQLNGMFGMLSTRPNRGKTVKPEKVKTPHDLEMLAKAEAKRQRKVKQ